MTDRKAVFDNVLAFCQVADSNLVPRRNVLENGYLLSVHLNNGTRRLWLYSYNHIVGRIDF